MLEVIRRIAREHDLVKMAYHVSLILGLVCSRPYTAGELYREYSELCRRANVKPRGYTCFFEYLKKLERLGLIKREVVSFGRYGRMAVICSVGRF